MSGDILLAAACGLYCADCEFYPEKCAGCGYIEGKPFWAAQFGMEHCALYNCAVNRSSLEHCGECRDFPCDDIFLSMRDPNMTDEEAEASLAQRQRDLRRRREIGTAAWLEERETSTK
jgi:hypothetical protein